MSIATVCAGATVALGVYGSITESDAKPAGTAILFSSLFFYALHRVQSSKEGRPPFQIVLAILLVCCSFAVHLAYLPAGIGCFGALMLCKNDLIIPPPPPKRKQT